MHGMTRARSLWPVALMGALLLSVTALAGASTALVAERAAAEPTAAATEALSATSPDEAVRLAVERQGETYAGDCAATISPRDAGKICSKLVETRGDQRAYLTGRTFSEFSTWVFVEESAAGWRVAGTAALDFFAESLVIPWPN